MSLWPLLVTLGEMVGSCSARGRQFVEPLRLRVLRVVMVVAVAGSIVAATPSAFASGWSIQRVPPAPLANGHLSAVFCTSSDACTAVGYFLNTARFQTPLAEQWNGVSWTNEHAASAIGSSQAGIPCASTSDPACGTQDQLTAVSCTSSRSCIAVGYFTNSRHVQVTLAERWNGRRWTIERTPNPRGGTQIALNGVSCAKSACIAVGSYTNSGLGSTAFVERRDRGRWSLMRIPPPRKAASTSLSGVSCTSERACVAVGFWARQQDRDAPLIERLTANRWSPTVVRRPRGASSELRGVSCTGPRSCTAVGTRRPSLRSNATYTLAMRWNGARWEVERTPSPVAGGSGHLAAQTVTLSAVSCRSARSCTAVGSSTATYDLGGRAIARYRLPLAESWNGKVWSVQSAPNPATNPTETPLSYSSVSLSGVSCTSPSACTAVGSYPTTSGYAPQVTLAERWNGSAWALQTTVNGTGTAGGALKAISCASAHTCIAVGSYPDVAHYTTLPLARNWDGSSWTVIRTGLNLSDVSCTSPTHCLALGGTSSGPLVEQWDGLSWSVQTPLPTSGVSSMSCTSATFCIAVGATSGPVTIINGVPQVPIMSLAEMWDGSTWSVQTAPNPPGVSDSRLTSVSCTSPTSCIAVGGSGDHKATLAEMWDGQSWTIQNTAFPTGATLAWLNSVSCSAPTACTAVGWSSHRFSDEGLATLAERWDGTRWTLQPTPNPSGIGPLTPGPELNAVSCPSDTTCTAVGEYGTIPRGQLDRTLAEVWDGSHWRIQRTPSPPTHAGYAANIHLSGVSCTSATSCEAVGESGTEPLAEGES